MILPLNSEHFRITYEINSFVLKCLLFGGFTVLISTSEYLFYPCTVKKKNMLTVNVLKTTKMCCLHESFHLITLFQILCFEMILKLSF